MESTDGKFKLMTKKKKLFPIITRTARAVFKYYGKRSKKGQKKFELYYPGH